MGAQVHIVVAGAGAMGSLFGGRLAERGLKVTLFGRREDHAEAIRRGGLRIVGWKGERTVRLGAETDPALIAPADILLVQCKAGATGAVASRLRPVLKDGGLAVSFQNGLGNEEVLASILGAERVVGGLTSLGATLEGPGIVRDYAELPTVVGEVAGGLSERVGALAALLSHHGIPTEASPDIVGEKWRKLLLNVALSAPSGLTGLTIGGVVSCPPLKEVARRAMDEAAAVALACGVHLPVTDRYRTFEGVVQSGAAGNKTSMRRDLEAGRPTEVAAIYGSVIALGRARSVPVPTLETLAALIAGAEANNEAPGP